MLFVSLQNPGLLRDSHGLKNPEELLESMSQANHAFKTGNGPNQEGNGLNSSIKLA